jgi:hypothetical protein
MAIEKSTIMKIGTVLAAPIFILALDFATGCHGASLPH